MLALKRFLSDYQYSLEHDRHETLKWTSWLSTLAGIAIWQCYRSGWWVFWAYVVGVPLYCLYEYWSMTRDRREQMAWGSPWTQQDEWNEINYARWKKIVPTTLLACATFYGCRMIFE